MYCTKCGNILKQEDNFCNICGAPNEEKGGISGRGMSGHSVVRDDEPVKLDDFFKYDEKAEKTLEKMDREIEEIKARATENLLRRKNGDASARRAARLARRAAESRVSDINTQESRYNRRNTYEPADNLEFNDQIFQKTFDKSGEPLVGRRGQIKDKTKERQAYAAKEEPAAPAFEETAQYPGAEDKAQPVKDEQAAREAAQSTANRQNQQKQKRHHLFREDTMELPNIFEEIAKSMEKSKQQEDDFAEGVFPIPPKDDFTEGVFPIPPKDDFTEGVFPIPPKDDFTEGVFPIPPKDDFTEGVFPIPPKDEPAEGVFPVTSDGGLDQNDPASGASQDGETPVQPDQPSPPEQPEIPEQTGQQTEDSSEKPVGTSLESTDEKPTTEELLSDVTQFDSTFGIKSDSPEYEYFRYARPRKKKSNGFAVVLVVLIVIFTALAVKMFYDGDTPATVFNQIKEIFNISQDDQGSSDQDQDGSGSGDSGDASAAGDGQDSEETPDISQLKEEGATDQAKMLQYLLSQGINKNIAEVTYNPDLKYEQGKKYKSEDIDNSTVITDNVFYEENGQKYYFTEKIMSTMIQYNSQWIDYFNTGDKSVLNQIKKDSPVYQRTVNFTSDGAKESFVKFEMGEIRKGKDGYYIWTKETLSVTTGSKTNSEEGSWIYYLEPSGKSMKIVNNYYL